MSVSKQLAAVLPLLFLGAAARGLPPDDLGVGGASPRPAGQLVVSVADPDLRGLLEEVLDDNPGIRAAAAQARAAAQRAPQVGALPDPVASLTAFLATPETRTGPQKLAAGISQRLPWFGKLELAERAALLAAAALEAEVEAQRLEAVTETRRLYYELAFLARQREITEQYRTHLLKHEEIARARYSSGVGQGQGVVKLQAEITRRESELIGLENRRIALVAQINALRAQPAGAPVPEARLSTASPTEPALEDLLATAKISRPELAGAEAQIGRAAALTRLAEKGYRPDLMVGVSYVLVDPRQDAPGRAQPPPGNGDDVVGLQAGITLPVRRKKLLAAVAEAEMMEVAAAERKRAVVAGIEAAVGDLAQRVPLDFRQLRLLEDLLVVQAEEALDSAEAGYIAGTLNALDLLDAEHVLFQAHTATARARADHAIAVARLEGAVGRPLRASNPREGSDS